MRVLGSERSPDGIWKIHSKKWGLFILGLSAGYAGYLPSDIDAH